MNNLYNILNVKPERIQVIITMLQVEQFIEDQIAFLLDLFKEGSISSAEAMVIIYELGYAEGHLDGEKSKLSDLWNQPQYSN